VKNPLFNTIILIIALAVITVSRLVHVDVAGVYLFGIKWPVHCVLNHTFGVKCAMCGLTHSFSEMAKGNAAKAIEYHAIGPALFAFTVFQIPYRIYAIAIHPRRVNRKLRQVHMVFGAIVCVALLITWLIYLGGTLL
jgi:hypothetical protein